MEKQRTHYLHRNGCREVEFETRRMAGFPVAKELRNRDYEVQCLGQASSIRNSRSCPGYKDTVLPIRPGYLRQKGDRDTLMKIEQGGLLRNTGRSNTVYCHQIVISILYIKF